MATIASISRSWVPDDGAYEITATGTFDSGVISVNLIGAGDPLACLAIEQESTIVSDDGTTVTFLTPLAEQGLYDVEVVDGDGSDTLADALTVVPRTYPSTLYTMRSDWLPSPRLVGALQVQDEDAIAAEVGLWAGLVSAIADTLFEAGAGRLLTRTTANYTGGGTLTVESTDRFATTGRLVFGAIEALYSGTTATTFTGLTDIAGNAIADVDVPAGSVVMDDSLTQGQFAGLRASFLLSQAQDAELDELATNHRLHRIIGMNDDELFRDFLAVTLYGPAGTIYQVELICEVLRPGDYVIYEDLPVEHHTVFVDLAYELSVDPDGRAYIVGGEEATSTSTTTVDTDQDPTLVYGIWLDTDPEREGTNYANIELAVDVTNYTVTSAALFVAGDDGKDVIIAGTDYWIIDFTNTSSIDLVGRYYDDGIASSSTPTKFRSENARFAPWMAGHDLEFDYGTGSGSAAIVSVDDPYTVTLVAAVFTGITAINVTWRVNANYSTPLVGTTAHINRTTIVGNTVTFPTALAGSPTDLLVDYTTVDSAIALYGPSQDGTDLSPFYLYDDTYLVQAALDLVIDAGFRAVVRNE